MTTASTASADNLAEFQNHFCNSCRNSDCENCLDSHCGCEMLLHQSSLLNRPGLASMACMFCPEDETSEHVFLQCTEDQLVQLRQAALGTKLKNPVLGAETIEQLIGAISSQTAWRGSAVGDARTSGSLFSLPYSLYHLATGLLPAALSKRLDQLQMTSVQDAMQRSLVCIHRMWLARCNKKHRGTRHAGQQAA